MKPYVTVRVPAKVNLFLGVGPRESSGYHELATVFQAVSIFDEVTVMPADALAIASTGPLGHVVPCDSSNLAWQAAELLAERFGRSTDVLITIDKHIPVAAGMAGGSADAAATLVALDALWDLHCPREELDEIAAQLGSDVPFMLHGGCALGTGRGDLLMPIMTRGEFHWVFATFRIGLSTADVYRQTDNLRGVEYTDKPAVPSEVLHALGQADPRALGPLLANDLQDAALDMRPQLREVLVYGRECGALGALVSGSGPTCAFLASDGESAAQLASSLHMSGLVDGVSTAHGPVHGPRVVAFSGI